MRGMQYDHRAEASLDLHASQGIYSRDQFATHFRRIGRSVNRHGLSNFSGIIIAPFLTNLQREFSVAQHHKKSLKVVQIEEIERQRNIRQHHPHPNSLRSQFL